VITSSAACAFAGVGAAAHGAAQEIDPAADPGTEQAAAVGAEAVVE
jgi:hypothetical protein